MEQNTGYAVILNYTPNSGTYGNIAEAELLLSNGTTVPEAFIKDTVDLEHNYFYTGDIIEYEIDNRGKYDIKLVAKVNDATQLTEEGVTYYNSSVSGNFESAAPASSLKVKNESDTIDLIVGKDKVIKADGNTIFLIKDKDAAGEPFYDAYYGIKNVPSVDTDRHKPDSVNNATVLCDEENEDLAVIVYIDASEPDAVIDTSKEDYVYVLYNPENSKQYDTNRGYYYEYDAIVNGELTKIDINETTYSYLDPTNTGVDSSISGPQSTLFTVVQVDENDVYSLEGPQSKSMNISNVDNGVLNIAGHSLVAAPECKVFYIDEKDAVSDNTVGSVTENTTAKISYFTDTGEEDGKLLCVVIDELPEQGPVS